MRPDIPILFFLIIALGGLFISRFLILTKNEDKRTKIILFIISTIAIILIVVVLQIIDY